MVKSIITWDFLPLTVMCVPVGYKFFHSSRLLRPPVITCDKAPKVIPPAIWYTEDIEMEQVLCGAWQERAGKRIVIFVFNISEQDCCFKLTIPFKEYGIEQSQLDVNGFTVNRDKGVIKDKLSAESHKAYEFGISETNKLRGGSWFSKDY